MVANHVLCQLSYTPDKQSEISNLRSEISEDWLRGRDLNPRPLGYEPNELPDCSTPRQSQLLTQTRSKCEISNLRFQWWAWVESNYRPHAYQACALTN